MTTWTMVWLILGCAVVTWLPRVIPFILVKSVTLPAFMMRFLTYIPVCILSALVFDSLYTKGVFMTSINWLNFAAFLPTLFVAIWTKSLSKTVIVGVLTMALLRYFFA